ncbi:MAG: DUF342 domain-containing protein [Desulfobacteraceae bacterium]|nr:DUF342 domain-containing protein [Desulfobacteraceae bacterium]
MTQKNKPKVIILENDETVRKQSESVLSKEGWDVTSCEFSKDALETLSQSKKSLFVLFISNFKLPKMEGDNILQKVKSISPLTQRMLLVPTDKPETLISAINKANINGCITIPFEENDLINQARSCFKQFKRALKRKELKRATVKQTKKMFHIAQKLKKKEETITHTLAEKKTQKVSLRLKKRELNEKNKSNTEISLSNLIEHRAIQQTPSAFQQEFEIICKSVKTLFDRITEKHNSDPLEFNSKETLNPKAPEEKAPEDKAPEEKAPEDKAPEDKAPEGKTNEINKGTIDPPEKEQIDSKKDGQETAEATDLKKDNPEEQAPEKELKEDKVVPIELIEKILKVAFIEIKNKEAAILDESGEIDDFCEEESSNIFNEYFKIAISKDKTKASIKKIKDFDKKCPQFDLSNLYELLKQRDISYGILGDDAVETWISKSFTKEIIIAQGKAPDHGRNGEIKFHFETTFTNPGKIDEEGTIDFRDRGDIPYTKKGELLAQKTPMKESKDGISISGIPIPVDEALDPIFVSGPGTEMSEDELSVFADIDGQPHLDAMGIISVNPELVIPGDVDFNTGNIEFKGNIQVQGMIKEGFKVKGINLTVKEIDGGTIDLSGDLNVSAGITESTITTHGNIYAKFINHSNVMGFGDLSISKEIIDSEIILSGSCQNQAGHIISSKITAKLGIDAGKIGTPASKPVKLKVGVDEHIETLKTKINEKLEASVDKIKLLKDEITKLEGQDQELHQQISEKAHIQDRAQIEIKEFQKSLPELEKANDFAKIKHITKKIKSLVQKAKDAEKDLNTIFEAQDKIAKETEQFKSQINLMEEKNKALVIEIKALKEFSKKESPKPVVTVAKAITMDSMISGPHSSIILKDDRSRCKIVELGAQEEGIPYYDMDISDL